MKSRKQRFRQPDDPIIKEHLLGFADAFLKPEARERWRHLLCERPDKAREELHRFDLLHAPAACTEVERHEAAALLLRRYGATRGVFFDGSGPALFLDASSVLDRMSPYPIDALLSFVAGREAVFFHHDRAVWLCGFRR
jgi:hypothetical protein